ncbi:MT-A70 family methyltransferase [Bradyrhizobium sp. Ash2021]|uniref:MT-A70 family methyltransferase n=1 Tax=Bradyrhizobium sp. Ash2021 TaxID=2954771 RepID=UPI002814A499|nr:MT-A70 family methyltransferase [Bradyrhizobium sp. Ash2021]WMT71898.1 MT-A70 family methyltransferase [Bradyrhizobium sp. Ash2021]
MFVSNTSALTGVQPGENFPQPETAARFFNPLAAYSYDLVVIDPPWPFKTWSPAGQGKSPSAQYRVMTLAEIMALPVRDLLKDHAVVLLWATGAMLDQAVAVMQAWGITYKTELAWRKVTRNGKVRMGCGFWARTMHEPILLGTVGKPPKITLPSLFDGVAREHSRKPDEFYRMITERTPDLRRADVFAREKREGWDAWGDEVGRFSSPGSGTERNTILMPGREQTGVQS